MFLTKIQLLLASFASMKVIAPDSKVPRPLLRRYHDTMATFSGSTQGVNEGNIIDVIIQRRLGIGGFAHGVIAPELATDFLLLFQFR